MSRMAFDQQMDKLGSEVVAALVWNVVDDPEVKAAFNRIRSAIEGAGLGFTQTKLEHSKGRNPPWVGIYFKSGQVGDIDMTWRLSQRLGDLADIASTAKLANQGGKLAADDYVSQKRHVNSRCDMAETYLRLLKGSLREMADIVSGLGGRTEVQFRLAADNLDSAISQIKDIRRLVR